MLNLAFLNPIIVHLFTVQILFSTMGKYSKEFKSMKNGSSCIFKSFRVFLVVLFIISTVQMSESNVEDVVTEAATNQIETDNLQSSEEKTEEPVKLMNQLAYLQAGDDDDSEQQNDASFLVAETAAKTKMLRSDDAMIQMLRGDHFLKEQFQPNAMLLDDPSNAQDKRMYLEDHQSEIERIRSYLPNLMKLKRLVKKCQCSYRDEDQYSSLKDAMIPNHIDHRVNLDYLDNDDEPDDDDREDDDDSQYGNVFRQRNFNYNKYKRFDLNNFRDDEDMETENEDFETIPKFNQVLGEDKNFDENSVEEFQDSLDESNSEENSVDEDEFDETEENGSKDEEDPLNGNNLSNNNNSEQNEKLLSPFMANLSPTSSSDLIFNNFNNEMSAMNTLQADQAENNGSNELQLAKLKRIITDGTLTMNDSDYIKQTYEMTNPLDTTASAQYALMSNGRVGSRRGGGKTRNLFDLILIRKRRQAGKGKSQLESKKGKSNSNRN